MSDFDTLIKTARKQSKIAGLKNQKFLLLSIKPEKKIEIDDILELLAINRLKNITI